MSDVSVLKTSLWVRFLQLFGRKKPQTAISKPDSYSTEKVLAMVKRVAVKTTTWEMGPKHFGLLMTERLQMEGQGIISAEKLQFVNRWVEVTAQDPMMILFLFDQPQWNNPYPITDFDSNLCWMFDQHENLQEAYRIWNRELLLQP